MLQKAYRRRELSPVEVTRQMLEAIEHTAETLNAYVFVDPEAALAAATSAEARFRHGHAVSLLDGVPAALKDTCSALGWPTRKGSLTVAADFSSEDSPYVARLRAAGAIFLGKTAVPEFNWKHATDSPLHGFTRNPWNLTKNVGGSSGGAAAAVAAGLATIAIGSDGGGSIRTPASMCGVVGFKPSFGRVNLLPGEGDLSLTVVGPLAHSAEDAKILFSEIVSVRSGDWNRRLRDSVEDVPANLRGVRVALSLTLGFSGRVDPEIASAVESAAHTIEALGASVELADPGLSRPTDAYNTIAWAEQAHKLHDTVTLHREIMDPGLVRAVEIGKAIGLDDYLDALAKRQDIINRMKAFHSEFDLLMTPSVPMTALNLDQIEPNGAEVSIMNDWLPYSSLFNLTGQPALTLPCGIHSNGLPMGVQLTGALNEDFLVLNVGIALERSLGFDSVIGNQRLAASWSKR